MKNLPANLILEKNKITSANAWLVLLEIVIDAVTYRYVKNTDNVTFDGNVYTAFPFEIEASNTSLKGEIPTVILRLSNINGLIQGYLEDTDGGVGATVKVIIVNSGYLAEDYAELTLDYDVLSTQTDSMWATFTLGFTSPARRRFPFYRYISDYCAWQFKGVECKYVGAETYCKRTLEACTTYSNTINYGGHLGLSGKVRLVR